MSWYNFWKKKVAPVVEQPVVEELPQEAPLVTSVPFTFIQPQPVFKSTWRNGMWVMTSKGIGVIFDLKNDIVHLVNEKGETVNALVASPIEMRQARMEEIPKPRRIGLTTEKAAQLGYM
jgi:hypothetical protein